MSYASRRSRYEQRSHHEVEVRIALLEEDEDEKDRQLAGIREELKNTNRILTGLLITIASAAIIGALNLLFTTV